MMQGPREFFVAQIVFCLFCTSLCAQSVSFTNGTITIRGGTEGDLATVTARNNSLVVVLNSQRSVFAASGVTRVIAYLGDGDDRIDTSSCTVPCFLYGGNGNDLLLGGERSDVMKGGPGNDVLAGGSGGDNLSGEDGVDLLIGGLLNRSSVEYVASVWLTTPVNSFADRVLSFRMNPPGITFDKMSDRFEGGSDQDLFIGDFATAIPIDLKVDFNIQLDADEYSVPDTRKIYFIGNSLTADLVPSHMQGDVKWHIDYGRNLKNIFQSPDSPGLRSSTPWPRAFRRDDFDVLVVQPHFGTTLEQDIQIISIWMAREPSASLIIHTGWTYHAEFETKYHSLFDPEVDPYMIHSPSYFSQLVSRLQEVFPDRNIKLSSAIDLLDSIVHDIESGKAPFESLADLYRDPLHIELQAGRYLMHNFMRAQLGQQFNRDTFVVDFAVREYLDLKILEIVAPIGE